MAEKDEAPPPGPAEALPGGEDVCPDCDGSGVVAAGVCDTCGGTGWVQAPAEREPGGAGEPEPGSAG